jgi:hypothetical protein
MADVFEDVSRRIEIPYKNHAVVRPCCYLFATLEVIYHWG